MDLTFVSCMNVLPSLNVDLNLSERAINYKRIISCGVYQLLIYNSLLRPVMFGRFKLLQSVRELNYIFTVSSFFIIDNLHSIYITCKMGTF